jgi:hypothetical protein
MSDERLRMLERRWKETGAVEDEAAYLQERLRTGDLARDKLELAAYLGYPGARAALGGEAPPADDLERVRRQRDRLEERHPGTCLTPLTGEQIRDLVERHPDVPRDLLLFLKEVGVGDVGQAEYELHTPDEPSAHCPFESITRQKGTLLVGGDYGRRWLVYDTRRGWRLGWVRPDRPRISDEFPSFLEFVEWVLLDSDPRTIPWHDSHLPPGKPDPAAWIARCREWCQELETGWSGYDIRTHLECPRCRFGFIYRTSNFSMGSDSDVLNHGVCCDPDCKHEWEEWS